MAINPDLYDEFSCQTTYTWNTGIQQMPVQGPFGTACKIVQVHAPMGQKVVAWRAKATGKMPKLPPTKPSNNNEVLAGTCIKPAVPSKMPDGQIQVMVEGMYTYFLRKPVTSLDEMPTGIAPFDGSDPAGNTIIATDFDERILRGVSANPTFATPAAVDVGLTGVVVP